MENKVLVDLSIKYGLDEKALSKVSGIVYQLGYKDVESLEFLKTAEALCEAKILELPEHEILEQMKRLGFE